MNEPGEILAGWIILPEFPQDQLGIFMYYVYSAG
jgi:hypothetical protein